MSTPAQTISGSLAASSFVLLVALTAYPGELPTALFTSAAMSAVLLPLLIALTFTDPIARGAKRHDAYALLLLLTWGSVAVAVGFLVAHFSVLLAVAYGVAALIALGVFSVLTPPRNAA